MFKFLRLGRRAAPEPVIETQRETFTRLIEELNSAIDALADKPAITLDPATGHVSFDIPEQFPDEALALPAPQEGEEGLPEDPKDEAEPKADAAPSDADPSEDGPDAPEEKDEKLDGKAA